MTDLLKKFATTSMMKLLVIAQAGAAFVRALLLFFEILNMGILEYFRPTILLTNLVIPFIVELIPLAILFLAFHQADSSKDSADKLYFVAVISYMILFFLQRISYLFVGYGIDYVLQTTFHWTSLVSLIPYVLLLVGKLMEKQNERLSIYVTLIILALQGLSAVFILFSNLQQFTVMGLLRGLLNFRALFQYAAILLYHVDNQSKASDTSATTFDHTYND